jgi:hypothetical protein
MANFMLSLADGGRIFKELRSVDRIERYYLVRIFREGIGCDYLPG